MKKTKTMWFAVVLFTLIPLSAMPENFTVSKCYAQVVFKSIPYSEQYSRKEILDRYSGNFLSLSDLKEWGVSKSHFQLHALVSAESANKFDAERMVDTHALMASDSSIQYADFMGCKTDNLN